MLSHGFIFNDSINNNNITRGLSMNKKIKDMIIFDKITDVRTEKQVILLDINNTLWNIKTYIKNKYPTLNIEIINEGMGDR